MTDFYSDEAQKYLADGSIHWTACEEGGSPLPYAEAAELAIDSYWPDESGFVSIFGWRDKPYTIASFRGAAEFAIEDALERVYMDVGDIVETINYDQAQVDAVASAVYDIASQVTPWALVVELRIDAKRWVAEND